MTLIIHNFHLCYIVVLGMLAITLKKIVVLIVLNIWNK